MKSISDNLKNSIVLILMSLLSLVYGPFAYSSRFWHSIFDIILSAVLFLIPCLIAGLFLKQSHCWNTILIITAAIFMAYSIGFFGWPESFSALDHLSIFIKVLPIIILCNILGFFIGIKFGITLSRLNHRFSE